MDKADKINFNMEMESATGLEFLDLKLKIVEGKIRVDLLLNLPTVLAIPHLTSAILRKTYAVYLKA